MRLVWLFFLVLVTCAEASGQNYKVETYKLFELFGDVKRFSCGGGCCEGHDSTACVGVQVLRENESQQYVLVRTAIFDNVSCCVPQCADRQGCGIYGKDGPANSCPNNTSRLTVSIGSGSLRSGNLGLCVAPGQVFRVPVRVGRLGNVVNNSWTSGSNCSAGDPFEPYGSGPIGSDTWGGNSARWGGFIDSCPNPVNPDIVCVPSDCTPGENDNSHAVPRYGVDIVSPYGNEYLTRWDTPLVNLRWRATTPSRLDSYRVVVYGPAGLLIDRRVACDTVECHYAAEFPLERASYNWWVQPVSSTAVGDQSRSGTFNLFQPLPSCAGIGGSCAFPVEPGAAPVCAAGSILIYGALDCPDTCCGVDCESEYSHAHTGSCGTADVCGHVFGTPQDAGCVGSPPPDTRTCGELGGEYCSTTLSCPPNFVSLGTTRQEGAVECLTCCDLLPSCGSMGGSYCSQTGSCPSGYDLLGNSSDCNPCCEPKPRPSCGAMGGDYCSQTGRCPANYRSLGASSDCSPCCDYSPPPSCGAMGGDYCSQTGSCPANYRSLGPSSDCRPCCDYSPPPSCGTMGGDYCSQSASCPSDYTSLGASSDCVRCCRSE